MKTIMIDMGNVITDGELKDKNIIRVNNWNDIAKILLN